MVEGIVTLAIFLIALVIGCVILYYVVRAAVEQGTKDALLSLQVKVDMRNTVQAGVLEAMQELEKSRTEEQNG